MSIEDTKAGAEACATWKLVPTIATSEMLSSGKHYMELALRDGLDRLARQRVGYEAMLAAAPTPPPADGMVAELRGRATGPTYTGQAFTVHDARAFSRAADEIERLHELAEHRLKVLDNIGDWVRATEYRAVDAEAELLAPTVRCVICGSSNPAGCTADGCYLGKPPLHERIVPAQGEEVASPAAADVLAERRRQVEVEGWSPEHDDQHQRQELSLAAACYAMGTTTPYGKTLWPWHYSTWKPRNYRTNLVKAGALILAEIERLDRAAHKGDA